MLIGVDLRESAADYVFQPPARPHKLLLCCRRLGGLPNGDPKASAEPGWVARGRAQFSDCRNRNALETVCYYDSNVRIRVLFFGVLRDIVGLREDSLDLPEGGRLGLVFELYAGRFPRLRGDGGKRGAGS